jgi:hypothetical protein
MNQDEKAALIAAIEAAYLQQVAGSYAVLVEALVRKETTIGAEDRFRNGVTLATAAKNIAQRVIRELY